MNARRGQKWDPVVDSSSSLVSFISSLFFMFQINFGWFLNLASLRWRSFDLVFSATYNEERYRVLFFCSFFNSHLRLHIRKLYVLIFLSYFYTILLKRDSTCFHLKSMPMRWVKEEDIIAKSDSVQGYPKFLSKYIFARYALYFIGDICYQWLNRDISFSNCSCNIFCFKTRIKDKLSHDPF